LLDVQCQYIVYAYRTITYFDKVIVIVNLLLGKFSTVPRTIDGHSVEEKT